MGISIRVLTAQNRTPREVVISGTLSLPGVLRQNIEAQNPVINITSIVRFSLQLGSPRHSKKTWPSPGQKPAFHRRFSVGHSFMIFFFLIQLGFPTPLSRIGLWTVPQKAHDNNGPIINAIGY